MYPSYLEIFYILWYIQQEEKIKKVRFIYIKVLFIKQ